MIEKTLERPGCRIYYWVSLCANKPWIILLHGAGADHRMFDEQVSALTDRYNLLVWDARGHGRSRPMDGNFSIRLLVDDLLAVMDAEGIKRAALLGQSMGGNLAQDAIYMHSQRFDRLVLVDTGRNTMRLSLLDRWMIALTPAMMRLYPWKTLVRQSAEASSVRADVRAYLTECFETVGKADFTRILVATTACLRDAPRYRVPVPFLLLVGEQDGTGTIRKGAETWAAEEPECEFHWLKDAGHCANQDQPEEFNRLLLDFLARTE